MAVLIGLAGCTINTQQQRKETMDKEVIEVTQSVDVAPMSVVVTLHMVNRSDKPVLLERFGNDLHPTRQEFEITSNGTEIDYIGPMMKRRPYTKEDFFALEPGKEYTRKTRIDQAYDFLKGTHEYTMVYWYLQFDEANADTSAHPSAPVKFVLTR